MAVPALSSTSTIPSRASTRSATALTRVDGQLEVEARRRRQADDPAIALAQEAGRRRRRAGRRRAIALSASMRRPAAVVVDALDGPAFRRPSCATSTVPQATSTRTVASDLEDPAPGRERRAAAARAAHARGEFADAAEPAGQDPRREQAERPGHDQPAEDLERRPGEDQAEADADEDERPERPPSIEDGRVEQAGLDRQRHAARDDEEDAPARKVAMDPHAGHDTAPTRPVPHPISATGLC